MAQPPGSRTACALVDASSPQLYHSIWAAAGPGKACSKWQPGSKQQGLLLLWAADPSQSTIALLRSLRGPAQESWPAIEKKSSRPCMRRWDRAGASNLRNPLEILAPWQPQPSCITWGKLAICKSACPDMRMLRVLTWLGRMDVRMSVDKAAFHAY